MCLRSTQDNIQFSKFILKDHLNDLGIQSTVETEKIKTYLNKHKLNYYGSYDASRYYTQKRLKEANYKILIDLHRDSVK